MSTQREMIINYQVKQALGILLNPFQTLHHPSQLHPLKFLIKKLGLVI